jgi:hypothetical protein
MANKPEADWLAWTLQLIFGFVVGVIMAFVAMPRRTPLWDDPHGLLLLLAGGGLIGAAFGSHYGDRLWGEAYKYYPPDEPQQSTLSDYCSLVIGFAGFLCVLFCVLQHQIFK